MALLLLPALFSCSDNTLPESSGKADMEQVPLQVAGASTGTGIGVQTRAGGRTELTSGSIGMFMKADAAAGYTALDNQCFTYAAPFWQADEQILLGTPTATLAACYPYAPGRVNPVILRSRQYSAAGDFHYVNFRADKLTSVIRLDLSRVYSRIVFNFKANAHYTGAGKVTAIRLEGNGIVPVATLDMLDPSVNDPGKSVRDVLVPATGRDVVEIDGLTTQFTAAAAGAADCLMIPRQLQGDINLTITVDGGKMTGKVTATQLCGTSGTLTEGVKYEVNITVNQLKGLEIGTIKTTDWDSQPAWNEEVGFEPSALVINVPAYAIDLSNLEDPCTEQDKADLSKLWWAGGNLNGTNNSNPYTWASAQTDYGCYYAWMTLYTGDTTVTGTDDPCEKLDPALYGTGWRTPNQYELRKLSRCTDKRSVTNNGVQGMWFMNKPNGLFLPAAGYSANMTDIDTGTNGYYQSSDAWPNVIYNSLSLKFSNGSVRVDDTGMKSWKSSVRCVRGEVQLQ